MSKYLLPSLFIFCIVGPACAKEVVRDLPVEKLPIEKIRDHIYVVHGIGLYPTPNNRGFVNNAGFIVTTHGVIVVDPGGSAAIGNELLKKIRTITPNPVIAVFITHVHGDHWLGTQAIHEAYPRAPIYAHKHTVLRISGSEGKQWKDEFDRLTKNATSATQVVVPNHALEGNEVLNLDGMTLRIHHPGKAHTDGDLIIEVVDAQTIFLGDIATNGSIPSSVVPDDANYRGQIAALREVLSMSAEHFIPGHGRSGGREVPEAALDVLERIERSITVLFRSGVSAQDMKDKILRDLEKYRDWENYDALGVVISRLYLEMEQELF